MKSDEVLKRIRPRLCDIGFDVESSKRKADKISRPVFFGVNGEPTLTYEIDAYHEEWRCGLEVEAVRALRGGAVFRDIIQAMVMVQVDHLCIAVPNYLKVTERPDRTFDDTLKVVDALWGHSRVRFPFSLTLIGY